MSLPSDYPEIVAAGVATLRAVSIKVRGTATMQPDASELWLVVRDLEGLAGRLADLDEREWQDGFGATFVTGQDLGVLDELLEVGVILRASTIVSLTPEQAINVRRLRRFLQRHRDGSGDAESPSA